MDAMKHVRVICVLCALGLAASAAIADISLYVSGARVTKIPLAISVIGESEACAPALAELRHALDILGIFEFLSEARFARLNIEVGETAMSLEFKQLEETLVKEARVPCTNDRVYRFVGRLFERMTGVSDFFYTKVAFVGETGPKTDVQKNLYMMNINGSQVEKLFPEKDFVMFPRFSPSGQYLSFVSFEEDERRGVRPELFVMETRTQKLTRVFAEWGVGLGSAVFFPKNEKNLIVSIRSHRTRGLGVVSVDRPNQVRNLRYPHGFDVEPSIDPSGTMISFSSLRTGRPMIYTLPMAAMERSEVPNRLTFVGRYNSTPAFTADGQWIVFAGDQHNNFDLYKIDPSGNLLFRLTQTEWNEEAPFASPISARHILFSKNSPYGDPQTTGLQIMHIDFPGDATSLRVPEGVTIKTPTWSGPLPANQFSF